MDNKPYLYCTEKMKQNYEYPYDCGDMPIMGLYKQLLCIKKYIKIIIYMFLLFSRTFVGLVSLMEFLPASSPHVLQVIHSL